MAAVGCLEKEIQFQKEAIKEQDARQAQDIPLMKNIRIQLKTFLFPAIRRKQIRRSADVGCPIVDIPCSPGCASLRLPDMPFLPKGASAIPAACSCPAVARQRSCRHGSVAIRPSCRPGKRCAASPLSRSRDENTSRKPKTETCRPLRKKSFTGRGGPGEGDAFSKAPSSPGKPPKLPLQKTRLPLPHPRCHLPGRARPGAHRPRRGQASATARAGAP